MVRRLRDSWEGLQVLIDHRQSGSIGGFYGNGIGGFHAVPFALDARRGPLTGRPSACNWTTPRRVSSLSRPKKRAMLTKSAMPTSSSLRGGGATGTSSAFRCVGAPVLTNRLGQRSSGGGNRPGAASGSPLRSRCGAGSCSAAEGTSRSRSTTTTPFSAGPVGAQRPVPVAPYPY